MPTVTCVPGQSFDGLICTTCTIGRFSAATALPWPRSCSLCAAGTYNIASGQTSCVSCPVGKLSSSDRSFCDDCSAGEYAFNKSTCEPCTLGTYAPQALVDSCLSCTSGSSTNGVSSGATSCTPCDAGWWSSASSVNCSACAAGRASSAGASLCAACAAGTYVASMGSTTCTACSSGSFASVTGSTNCTACSTGKAQGATGQASCEACEAGTYSSVTGGTTCAVCQAFGTGYTSAAGASACEKCLSGYFRVPNDGGCVACPTGANCQESTGALLPGPKKGYWLSTTSANDFEGDLDLYRCPRLTCKGSKPDSSECWQSTNISKCDADALLCHTGARGPLCGSCSEGFLYSSSLQKCVGCGESWGLVGFIALVIIAVAVQATKIRLQKTFVSVVGTQLIETVKYSRFWGTARQIDSGTFRVL